MEPESGFGGGTRSPPPVIRECGTLITEAVLALHNKYDMFRYNSPFVVDGILEVFDLALNFTINPTR